MTRNVLCAVDINRPGEEVDVLKQAKKQADLDGALLDVITVVPDFGASVVGAYFKDHDVKTCLLYTSPSPRDQRGSRMPSSA